MGLLREYFWLWVVLVVIFLSFIIVLVFILINRCISRRGKRILMLSRKPKYKAKSERYQSTNIQNVKVSVPPLPSRSQFNTEVSKSQSYENLEDKHDYEDPEKNISHNYQKNSFVCQTPEPPDYIKVENEPDAPSNVLQAQSYENLAEELDYEEPDSNASHDYQTNSFMCQNREPPDYIKVENEPDPASNVLQAQSYENLADELDYEEPEANISHSYNRNSYEEPGDTASTEDYDDIGAEEDEDYDDIGAEEDEDYDDLG